MSSMKKMLILFSLAIVNIFISALHGQVTSGVKWVVLKDGAVKVDGSTNVNKFSCSITGYTSPDTLICYKNSNKDAAAVLSGQLALPVISFDCMVAMMTSDLRKTLKSKEHPLLRISFISLQKYPELKPSEELITGIVAIELAGASKKFEVNYRISMDGKNIIHMLGSQRIRFSDFHLRPPRKLGGMIKADDALDVTFRVNFKMLPG